MPRARLLQPSNLAERAATVLLVRRRHKLVQEARFHQRLTFNLKKTVLSVLLATTVLSADKHPRSLPAQRDTSAQLDQAQRGQTPVGLVIIAL